MFDLEPFKRQSELPSLFTEMDKMIKKMWFGFPFHNMEKNMDINWSPRIDVSETDKTMEIVADLPGMEKQDISASLDGDLLIIKGERKSEKESNEKHFHTIERTSGSFYRALRLPIEVEKDKIEATFRDGVLTLRLRKAKGLKKKASKIEIA